MAGSGELDTDIQAGVLRPPATYCGVAQLAARWAHNPEVVGSSPTPASMRMACTIRRGTLTPSLPIRARVRGARNPLLYNCSLAMGARTFFTYNTRKETMR